jgi:hypothetical protein
MPETELDVRDVQDVAVFEELRRRAFTIYERAIRALEVADA